MGLSVRGLAHMGSEVKVANIIVYCVRNGCLSEEANLSRFEPRSIYTADKMLNSLDLL